MTVGSRSLKFYQADVFTDTPFGGNPVAVFPSSAGLSDQELQQISREMNLSETVFVFPPRDPMASAKLRIFTPTKEIPFAGHPVVGTFHILGALKLLRLVEPVTHLFYECNIGVFPIELHVENGALIRVVMSQPKPAFLSIIDSREDLFRLAKALGVDKSVIADTRCPIQVMSTGLPMIVVPVRTLTAVRSIVPHAHAVTEICAEHGANGIQVFTMVTVESSSSVHTRVFCSPIGVLEDPATGSASGALGAYLVHYGMVDVAPITTIVVEQGYEMHRPSRIHIQVESEDDAIQEVKVGGYSVMVIEGTLQL
jgi:trans-2,3-dihydro-3-hydroxyanthranilate isomerase